MAGSRFDELLREGEALRRQQRYDEAIAVFEEVAQAARTVGDDDHVADALNSLAMVRSIRRASVNELAEVLLIQDEAIRIDAKNHGWSHPRVANGLRLKGSTLEMLGSLSEAAECLNRALIVFRAEGVPSLRLEDTLATLVAVLHAQGAYSEVASVANELIAVCERLQDTMRLMMAHFMRGQALVEIGEKDGAIAELERVLQLAAPRLAEGRAQRLQSEVETWLMRAHALSDRGP